MLIKKMYEGFTYLPNRNEIWKVFVSLMKEKDYFYSTFARNISDEGDKRTYEYAYFNLKGEVVDFDCKMKSDLILLFHQLFQENNNQFMEEIQMATQATLEKKIKAVLVELGELMKAHKNKEAWTKAGELNGLLKTEEAQNLTAGFVEPIRKELSGYYYVNGEINKLHKQLYAKGNKLIELANQ